MLFNSFSYAVFLPVVFILYWALPHRFRGWLLLIASYYFYMSWNVKYVVLILFTTLVSYAAGLLLEKAEGASRKKRITVLAVLLCLAVLFVFKYFNFVFENIAAIAGRIALPIHPVTLNLLLPVGISFYTFQTLSYIIDVYRGNVKAERSFTAYATFVSFFPQLVAGPIERTENLLPQIKARHFFHEEKALDGAKLMLAGYFKKLIVADIAAIYVDQVYADLTGYRGFDLILVMFLFTMQIYGDFSGYSDIAVGTAKLLDIDLMTNFKSPYLSASVKEFWSRWHISLSTWFRDYVYIPLGGNRCSKFRHNLNLLITFLLSGLWHGANWTYVVWGGAHGIARILEDALQKFLDPVRKTRIGRILCAVLVFVFCNAAWVFFRAESFADAAYVFSHVFDGIGDPWNYLQSSFLSPMELAGILVYIAVLAVYDCLNYHGNAMNKINSLHKVWQWGIWLGLGLVVVFCSRKGEAAEFVYFQF